MRTLAAGIVVAAMLLLRPVVVAAQPAPDATPAAAIPAVRDRIGRVLAPATINGQGPFRLVLDTGASHSGIAARVADALGLERDPARSVRVRGMTGTDVVPVVLADTFTVGELSLVDHPLPLITNPLAGADGILGAEGLGDKRVHVDLRNATVRIEASRREPVPDGFLVMPLRFLRGNVPTIDGRIGRVRVRAIIDTGAESTIANFAARNALVRQRLLDPVVDRIHGATGDVQLAERHAIPPLVVGGIAIRSPEMSFADLAIFDVWRMTRTPAIIVGMDALGRLDEFIIDYARSELRIKVSPGPN